VQEFSGIIDLEQGSTIGTKRAIMVLATRYTYLLIFLRLPLVL